MEKSIFIRNFKTALLFGVSFFLFAIVAKIGQSGSMATILKIAAVAAYGFFLLRVFTRKELIAFAGFSVLLIGHNYVWQDESIQIFWKLAVTIVVMLQIGTIGKQTERSLTNEN